MMDCGARSALMCDEDPCGKDFSGFYAEVRFSRHIAVKCQFS